MRWQPRYFELEEGSLSLRYYHLQAGGSKVAGTGASIDLNGLIWLEIDGKVLQLGLEQNIEPMKLRADTRSTAELWRKALAPLARACRENVAVTEPNKTMSAYEMERQQKDAEVCLHT